MPLSIVFPLQGSLIMWDVRTGEPVRLIKLGQKDSYVYINNILPIRDNGQVRILSTTGSGS